MKTSPKLAVQKLGDADALRFKKIDLRSRALIEGFVSQFDIYSDFNFVSLYSWAVNGGSYYCLTDSGLYLLVPDYGTTIYTPSFIGVPGYEAEIELFLKALASEKRAPAFKFIPEMNIAGIVRYFDQMEIAYTVGEDRDAFDYVIDTRKLAEANGGAYADMRYKLAKFERQWGGVTKKISFSASNPGHIRLATQLAKRWSEQAEMLPQQAAYEMDATKRFLRLCKHADNIRFIAYMHDNRLIGLSSYELVGKQKAVGHFLKYDRGYKGIYSVLVHESCLDLIGKGVSSINIEQDLGIEGLREAKMHLRPTKFMKKYWLRINT